MTQTTTRMMKWDNMRRVYVYSVPTRIFHWLNVLAILTLILTGYVIGNPPALMSNKEASFGYWFGTIRFIHFVAAIIFVLNFIFRIYISFAGNKYENWRSFLPVSKRFWKSFWQALKLDIFQMKGKEMIIIGHNPLASFTYFILFIVFIFQIISGFGMYAAMSDKAIYQAFVWIVPLMGGDAAVRFWHHLATWFFVIFSMFHVYLVFYHDSVEGRGMLSSMAGGWKFFKKDIYLKKEN